jgi:hypothetical protein
MFVRLRICAAFGLFLGAGSVAAQVDPMEEQRCVWSCLANSPGAESREYSDCVAQICTAIGQGSAAEAAPSAPVSRPQAAPVASLRPQPRPGAEPVAAETVEATPSAAPSTSPAEAPRLPAQDPLAAPGWSFGKTAEGEGMFAGVSDTATGARLDWLCAKGRGSMLALSPYAGGSNVTVAVTGRRQEVAVQVENGTAYMPISLSAPLFLHLASGPEVEFLDRDETLLGRFTMEGAALAIGQAEGRCR